MFSHAHASVHTDLKSWKPKGPGWGGCCQRRSRGGEKKEAKGWAKRKTEGERRRGKWSTVSAGGAELPGNVTMSSPWEHRARRLFWTNRQLSRQ